MTSEATIQEIQAEYGREQTGILTARQDAVNEIAAKGASEADIPASLADKLTRGQVEQILLEKKTALEQESRSETLEALASAHERYAHSVAKRAAHLKETLFTVEDPGALARASLATEGELKGLMAISKLASNKDLAKTVFVVAEQRGLGDLLHEYFEINGAARDLYSEWTQTPTPEQLARQREGLSSLVSVPDSQRLMRGNLASVGI